MQSITTFPAQNYLITPAALALGERPPASIHDQTFLLVMSGVALANLEGKSTSQWLYQTLSFNPVYDAGGSSNSSVLNWAINHYGIPRPTSGNYGTAFSVQQWAPFATLNSIYDQSQSIDAGFAVDTWRPTAFTSGTDALTKQPISSIFNGIDVDVAVRDSDAWLYRVGFNITLTGKIVFPVQPIIG